MPGYNFSPIFEPQYIATSTAAALIFAPAGATGFVPDGVSYQLNVSRLVNISGSAVNLLMWRVPKGGGLSNDNIIIPTIAIPPASINGFPWFDVLPLWGINLQPGDSIWALADTANVLSITADGAVVTP